MSIATTSTSRISIKAALLSSKENNIIPYSAEALTETNLVSRFPDYEVYFQTLKHPPNVVSNNDSLPTNITINEQFDIQKITINEHNVDLIINNESKPFVWFAFSI